MAFFSELRFARRSLLRQPLVTLAAIVTLALGIGANTTIFSFLKGEIVDPFNYRDRNNTLLFWSENRAEHRTREGISQPDFVDFERRLRSFDRMAFVRQRTMAMTGGKEPHRVNTAQVSPEFFSFFSDAPERGRWFHPQEYGVGRNRVAVVSSGFAKSHPGQMLRLDGELYTVVGIAPPDFWFPAQQVSVWVPLPTPAPGENRAARGGFVLAHLRQGVTIAQANQELSAAAHNLAVEYPATNAGWGVHAYEHVEAVLGPNDHLLITLAFGVVGALLLVACSNVANLLLAQAAMRRREFAIRTAIGASRRHLARQSLLESLVLAALGGGLGLLAGFWAKDLLIAIFPSVIPISHRVADPVVLAFCAGVSILAALLFGAAPAWDASRADPIAGLKEVRGAGARTHGLAGAFVSSQIALSMILLVITGLMLEAMHRLQHLDLGFRPQGVVTAKLDPSNVRHRGDEQLREFYRAALTAAAALPNVRSVSAA